MTAKEIRDAITEIDLLGYADGFLDADPERKRAVEAFLREHPTEAERVNAYIEQNREIRRLYGPVIAEPLPERILEVLHRRRSYGGGGRWLRAAASVGVLVAAAAGGWVIGFEQHPPSVVDSFVEQALAVHPQARQEQQRLAPRIDLASAGGAVGRLPEPAAIDADPPDLSRLGYTLQDRRVVGSGEDEMVQMTYRHADGRQLSLFLKSRAQPDDRKIVFSDSGDVTMAHWLDGPLIYGVVAEGGEPEVEAVAETIQATARQTRRSGSAARIAVQGDVPTAPEATGIADEVSAQRLGTPEPAVATPRLAPIRAPR